MTKMEKAMRAMELAAGDCCECQRVGDGDIVLRVICGCECHSYPEAVSPYAKRLFLQALQQTITWKLVNKS